MRKTKTTAFAAALVCFSAITAYAGTSYSNYNTTVASFNGNGYTAYQTKATSGANGSLHSYTVGADYFVDVRMIGYDGQAGDWVRNVTDGTNSYLWGNSYQFSGESVRAQFSNDWNTPVSVQVVGEWKSN